MDFFRFDFYEIIVWVATALLCLIAAGCRRIPLRAQGGIGQPLPNPIAVILPIIFFTVVTALRKNVGDTFFYQYSFELMPDSGNPVNASIFFDSMFAFFQNIIRNMTDDPQWLIAFTGVFATPIPLFILYKYSHPFDMSIYMFVAYGYLGGIMNGVRQYMAAAITLCATRYLFSLKRGSFIKYAIVILIAYCMHSSAIILIPLYFIFRRKAWKLNSYLMILGSIVLVFIFDAILPSFMSALESTDYSQYSENGWFTKGEETGTNIFRSLVAIAPIFVAYTNRDRMKLLGNIGDVLTNIAFVNAAICIVSLYNWIFVRLTIYLSIYYIIFTVWVVNYSVKPRQKSAYVIITILMFFIYSRNLSYMISGYESDYFFPNRKLFKGQ